MRIRTIGTVAALALAVPLATAGFAQATDVAVVDNSYAPEDLTVMAGDTVTWTSSGSNPHTVTADDGSFDSNENCQAFSDSATGACMDSGESYEFTFDEPGTYPYYCRLHGGAGGQGMSGTIVVEAAPSTTGGDTTGGDTTGGDATGGDTTGGDTTGDDTTGADGTSTSDGEQADAAELPHTGPADALGLAILAAAVVVVGVGVLALRGDPGAR